MHFPFTAIEGQALFKLALTLAAVDPGLGGVLVSGPRGSAKSTLARGMADILPVVSETDTDDVRSPGFVTLPLGATTDMVVGTLNLEQVLANQRAQFQPGLLARADGGVLYVDEVNLLPDHLVDLLLDVSSSGVNHVERDGMSHQHSARFVLLGTMNPDEGELRAQLQDRFGLSVQLSNRYSAQERIQIVRLREAFDADPVGFTHEFVAQQESLTQNIQAARVLLPSVKCSESLRETIANGCMQAHVDGLRADIVWLRAARAHAALDGRNEVDSNDVASVSELVLAHRRNQAPNNQDSADSLPPQAPSSDDSFTSDARNSQPFARAGNNASTDHTSSPGNQNDADTGTRPSENPGENKVGDDSDWGQMPPQVQAAIAAQTAPVLPAAKSQRYRRQSRSLQSSALSEVTVFGRGFSAPGAMASARQARSVNWFSTLIANAGQWPLKVLRYRQARSGDPALHLVLLDTSASTLQSRWFSRAKGAVLEIAERVYLAREQLAMMGFGNQQVQMLLPRKRAPKSLKAWLDGVPAAGGTPMRQILEQALQYQQSQNRRTPSLVFKTYLITDGRSSQSFQGLRLLGDVLVIDIEQSAVRRGRARELSLTLDATYRALPA